MVANGAPVVPSEDQRRFFRRLRRLQFWVWIQERIQPSDLQITLFWSGVIGFCGALCSIAFRMATSFVHKIITGSAESGLVESFAQLPPLWRVVIPTFGGLLAGTVMYFGMRFRGQVTTADYMEAVVLGDGKISVRRSLVKCLSALFTISSGGSIGREGPLVQLAALVASLAGRWRRWSTPRLRLLVGCGAAAGIASAYNAPIAGALFVAEIVLGSVAMEIFGPLVFLLGHCDAYGPRIFRRQSALRIPPFRLDRNWEILLISCSGSSPACLRRGSFGCCARVKIWSAASCSGLFENVRRAVGCRRARHRPPGGLRQWI